MIAYLYIKLQSFSILFESFNIRSNYSRVNTSNPRPLTAVDPGVGLPKYNTSAWICYTLLGAFNHVSIVDYWDSDLYSSLVDRNLSVFAMYLMHR